MNEKISALLDAELERHEWDGTLGRLASDMELRKAWDRYHLMGAALRSELQVVVDSALADRIARRIETETVVRVPRGRVLFLSAARYGAGLALAASVAAVSVYGIRFVWPAAPHAAQPEQLAAATPRPQVRDAARSDTAARSEWEKSLNPLLVQHSAYSPTSGMGVMPYARIAGPDDNN